MMRMPSNGLPMMMKLLCRLLVHCLRHRPRRINRGVDPDVDDGGPAGLFYRLAAALQCARDPGRVAYFFAVTTQHFGELAERNLAQQVADIAALRSVLCELAVADLVHRAVVADNGEIGNLEAVGGFHVEGGHAEGAVAVVTENLLLRIPEPGGDSEAGPNAERTEGAGIHPLTRAARAHGLRRDRHHVTTVTDVDRVVGQELIDLVRHAVRIDRDVVRLQQRQQLVARYL